MRALSWTSAAADFDATGYIAPKMARRVDRCISYGMVAAKKALEDAGLGTEEARRAATSPHSPASDPGCWEAASVWHRRAARREATGWLAG